MNKKEYSCKICNKNYASASSLWNHNKKFHESIHKSNVNIMSTSCQLLSTPGKLMSTSCQLLSTQNINDVLQCKYCNNIFNIRQTRWKHEQKCKIKYDEINKLKLINCNLHNEIELLKKNNNQIISTNKIINNNNNNNTVNNNNNNTINNTINIVKFGTEKLSEILSEKEMLKIIARIAGVYTHQRWVTKFINNSINESIKLVHFNDKRPEFKNIFIKNLKDKYLQIYNGDKFVTEIKYNHLYEMIDNHIYNIHKFVNNNKNKFDENQLIKTEKYLKQIEEDAKCVINKIKYGSFYDYKVDDINTLIYNLSNNK